jgi:hypothetical protein
MTHPQDIGDDESSRGGVSSQSKGTEFEQAAQDGRTLVQITRVLSYRALRTRDNKLQNDGND